MNENIGFKNMIETFENLGKIKLNMSLYMEICGDIVNFRIAETMNEFEDSMYLKHLYGELSEAHRVATGRKIISILRSEMEKVEMARLVEMYGEEEPEGMSYEEEETDLTLEEVRERAMPRAEKQLARMVGEILRENREKLTDDLIVAYWNNERIISYKKWCDSEIEK